MRTVFTVFKLNDAPSFNSARRDRRLHPKPSGAGALTSGLYGGLGAFGRGFIDTVCPQRSVIGLNRN